MKTTKTQLRTKYKKLRSVLTDDSIEAMSVKIANNALKLPVWEFSFYHIFLAIREQKEVNTEYLLHILNGKDKNIVLSKSNFEDHSMQHFLLTDTTVIKKNKWNIPEPEGGIEIDVDKIDVVFVPLLAFDSKGNRIGYGKGFYDRFLQQCKPETIKIGLSFFEAEDVPIPQESTDVMLNYGITPEKVYLF